MSNISAEQAGLITERLHRHVHDTFDLAKDPDQVKPYHGLLHTKKVGAAVAYYAANIDIGPLPNYQEADIAGVLKIATAGHDADLYDLKDVITDSPHVSFYRKRIRNISGVAEDASAERTVGICNQYDIKDCVKDDIYGAIVATTVECQDGVLVQPRLLESGNPAVNFLAAKADIAHILTSTIEAQKEAIVLRLWLEQYPDAVASLLQGNFSIANKDTAWIAKDLKIFLGPMQESFAKSQYERIYIDAEACRLSDTAIAGLNKIFSIRGLNKHIAAMQKISESVTSSPEAMIEALNKAVALTQNTRMAFNADTTFIA